MVRIERISRLGWLPAGAALAAIALPTAATAAGLTFTGIEGTSTHKANVTTDGQLLTPQAAPASFFASSLAKIAQNGGGVEVPVAVPNQGQALVITSVHVAVTALFGQQNDGSGAFFYIAANNPSSGLNCTNSEVRPVDNVSPAATGTTVLPYDPGVAIPAGDQLCEVLATEQNGDEIDETTGVFGYSVPSADIPAAQVRHMTARQLRQTLAPKRTAAPSRAG